MLNWEQKITELCEKFEIDPEQFSSNDEIKECVAHYLGFPSFESFQSFPRPKYVIQDMAEEFRDEWKLFQAALGYACVDEIERQYFFERDDELKNKQITCLLKYMEATFELEFMIVVLKYLIKQIEFDRQLLLWNRTIKTIMPLLGKV